MISYYGLVTLFLPDRFSIANPRRIIAEQIVDMFLKGIALPAGGPEAAGSAR